MDGNQLSHEFSLEASEAQGTVTGCLQLTATLKQWYRRGFLTLLRQLVLVEKALLHSLLSTGETFWAISFNTF